MNFKGGFFLGHPVDDTDFTLGLSQKYRWFKIDIRWLLRLPNAVSSHVHSHLDYYYYIYIMLSSNYVQNAFWQSEVILDGF